MNKSKTFIRIGALVLLLAVILGAFGAHSLEQQLTVMQLSTFETGVQYQFYHGFALLLVGILLEIGFSARLQWAAWCFLIGIILFSGSIYLLATKDLIGLTNTKLIGPITPIGGTLFIAGWLICFISVGKPKKTS